MTSLVCKPFLLSIFRIIPVVLFPALLVAILPSTYRGDIPSSYVVAAGAGTSAQLSNPASTSSVQTENSVSSNRTVVLNADLSALSIRATEYLQRWKEVVQFSSKDYSDQMAAQFGIKNSTTIRSSSIFSLNRRSRSRIRQLRSTTRTSGDNIRRG